MGAGVKAVADGIGGVRQQADEEAVQGAGAELAGAEVVAICNKPPGWVLEGSGSKIKGYATVGAGFVSVEHLGDLQGLFLIRAQPGQTLGVTGKVLTGAYGPDADQSEVAATPALLRTEPAQECPKA